MVAKKDVIVLTCKRCGEDFLYEWRGSGKKAEYCEDCRQQIAKERTAKYKEMYKTNTFARKKITNKQIEDLAKKSKEAIEDSSFTGRLSKVLTELDTLRVEMCTLASEMNSYQSSYDKADQTYLHKLENVNADNPVETQKMIKEWQQSRNERRNIKDYIAILNNTISAIPYKNYANALPVIKGKNFITR